MASNVSSSTDPLIDEVRQRRRELFAECDNDLVKLGERIKLLQASHPDKFVDRRKRKIRHAR